MKLLLKLIVAIWLITLFFVVMCAWSTWGVHPREWAMDSRVGVFILWALFCVAATVGIMIGHEE